MENKKISVKAPAKINLTLTIGERRCDGYHNVNMIMQAVSLYDIITVSLNDSKKITVSCNVSGVPLDGNNLVYKATETFLSHIGVYNVGVHIDIEKNIPMQAGLAGGSTDCAGTLIALNMLYDNRLTIDKLKEIGGRLGADVPFCFDGGTQLATGIGTTLEKIYDMPQCYILLVKPNIGVNTGEAYKKADARTSYPEGNSEKMINTLKSGDILSVANNLYNDFQDILKLSDVERIKDMLISNGAIGACMSGSGPTVYGIFTNEDVLKKAEKAMKQHYSKVLIAEPIKCGCKVK